MSTYKPRKLIEGWRVDPKFAGTTMVAVPKKKLGEDFSVSFKNNVMEIKEGIEPLQEISFPQKFGAGEYTLCYFKWEPQTTTLFD